MPLIGEKRMASRQMRKMQDVAAWFKVEEADQQASLARPSFGELHHVTGQQLHQRNTLGSSSWQNAST
jgi:hypothetical protein